MHVEDTRRLFAEIEMFQFVLFLVSRQAKERKAS
jgi:hypothetical protein